MEPSLNKCILYFYDIILYFNKLFHQNIILYLLNQAKNVFKRMGTLWEICKKYEGSWSCGGIIPFGVQIVTNAITILKRNVTVKYITVMLNYIP